MIVTQILVGLLIASFGFAGIWIGPAIATAIFEIDHLRSEP